MSGEPGDGADRSFEPTQRRLEEARRRGEVPMSADLAGAAGLAGGWIAAATLGGGALVALGGTLVPFLSQAPLLADAMFGAHPQPVWGGILARTAGAVWPLFALPAALALLALVAQGALVVAPERLRPRAARLSPLAQARHRFGPQGLAEFVRGLAKVALVGVALWLVLRDATPRLVGLAGQPPRLALLALLEATVALLGHVAGLLVALGVADVAWQRLRFLGRQRMTRQEVVDEQRESEGDPHLKGARRQRAVSIAMSRMLDDVPTAAVVVVNPTHYAVALRWDRATGGAPVVVAKGVDEMAARIRERAVLAGVPIRRDPPTARAIHAACDIGDEVPRADWRAVAAAIRFAERMRRRARRP